MKVFKQIFFITMAMLSLAILLSGCNGPKTKTISMQDTILANSLDAEPSNWISEDSINTLLQANLPAELQQTYTKLISNGYKRVIMKYPDGGQADVSSSENGIYLGTRKNIVAGFFQSASGNVVEVTKVYRTLYRSEYFYGENQMAFDSIELDYLPEDTYLIRVAVTDDFSIMYNSLNNTYQCMQYRNVLGTSPVTNWDSIISPEKTPTPKGGDKGFLYNGEWYIPVIERNGDSVTFQVVKESEFDSLGATSVFYMPMKIGRLEVNACEITR